MVKMTLVIAISFVIGYHFNLASGSIVSKIYTTSQNEPQYLATVVGTHGVQRHQQYSKIDITNVIGRADCPRYKAYIISEGSNPTYDSVLTVQSKAIHVTSTKCDACIVTSGKLNYSSFGTYMREAWGLISTDATNSQAEYIVKIDDDAIVPEAWLAAVVDDMSLRGIKYAGDAGFWADRPVLMFGKMYIIETATLRSALTCLQSAEGPEPEDQKTGWCLQDLKPSQRATYLMDGVRIGHKDFRNKWMVVCIRCDIANSHAIQSYIKEYPELNQGKTTHGATNQGAGWS